MPPKFFSLNCNLKDALKKDVVVKYNTFEKFLISILSWRITINISISNALKGL